MAIENIPENWTDFFENVIMKKRRGVDGDVAIEWYLRIWGVIEQDDARDSVTNLG